MAHSYKCEKGNFRVPFGFCYCKAEGRYSFSPFRFAIEVEWNAKNFR